MILFFIQGDENDAKLKIAYKALMTIRLFEPTTDEYINFQKEMNRRMLESYNFTPTAGDEVWKILENSLKFH